MMIDSEVDYYIALMAKSK